MAEEQYRKLLSQRSATARLGINDRTFRKYRAEGLIKPIGVTEKNQFVFDEAEIDALSKTLKPREPFKRRMEAQQ
jgi:DNA-binding transcriptional MerR regulator